MTESCVMHPADEEALTTEERLLRAIFGACTCPSRRDRRVEGAEACEVRFCGPDRGRVGPSATDVVTTLREA